MVDFALIHYYQNAIVAAILLYEDVVTGPSHFAAIKDLLELGEGAGPCHEDR
jgi:hypothetical protein